LPYLLHYFYIVKSFNPSVFLNLFICLVEEAYVVVEIKNKKSWIYRYIKIEPKLVDLKLHSKKSLQKTKEYFKNFKTNSQKKSQSFKSHNLLVKKDSFAEDKLKPKEIKSYINLRQFESLPHSQINSQVKHESQFKHLSQFKPKKIDTSKFDAKFKLVNI
jgi:transposase-like protein